MSHCGSYEADFRQLVVQIADGNEPDPEAIEDVLAASQKSMDDLLNRRRELRRAVDGVQKLEEERKPIEGAIAEADRIFNVTVATSAGREDGGAACTAGVL